MSASVAEQILARAYAALLAANVAGSNVFRNRNDPLGEDEMPGIKVVRGPLDASMHARNVDRNRFEFSIVHLVSGADVETTADALHVASHQVLLADVPLSSLGAGLSCIGVEPTPDEADIDVYRLTARYQIQFLTRPGDPTRNLT